MAEIAASASPAVLSRAPASRRALPPETFWGIVLLIPYGVVFLFFVIYPVAYGFYLGSNPESYVKLWSDPIYFRTIFNTLVFLLVGVNLKMALALFLSGFFVHPQRWIRWLSIIFILPWAIPSIPTILSFRWMLNSEWGMINTLLFDWFGVFPGPGWLLRPDLGMGAVIAIHIWKYLPFWTLTLLAARLAISKDLYEAAEVDGASGTQRFRYVTWPGVRNMYLVCTLLSTIWSLGDFNSVYLLTGGGPLDRTHVLATLAIRYAYKMGFLDTGVAALITALPLVIPLVVYMFRRLGKGASS
ncbi:MAG: sugar ABC transporter permease [Proteobacteria bacterium]|nr:sugar ABC transporter permease [Pseudomonadota bacterium]MBI3499314.1 sugar ABC transporter permease [Pseudomonadota bacterium]